MTDQDRTGAHAAPAPGVCVCCQRPNRSGEARRGYFYCNECIAEGWDQRGL